MDSMTNNSNKVAYDEVFASLEKHNKWFEDSIPLIASENIPSPAVREAIICLLYTSPSPRDGLLSRMPSSA